MSVSSARLVILQKGYPVIATALALQAVTKEAVFDDESMSMAARIVNQRNEMDEDDFAKALFIYSCHLTALTTTLATNTLLTKSEIDEMIETIKEMESMEIGRAHV